MVQSTVAAPTTATAGFMDFLTVLMSQLLALFALVEAFRQQTPTPSLTHAFESGVNAVVRETARVLIEHTYNHIEPQSVADCPMRLRLAGEEYKRRPKSHNTIGTLFGKIGLNRYLYEAIEPGEPAIFPLEMQLGIEAGLASPALAERVGLWSAEHEQDAVLNLLKEEHDVA